MVDLFSIHLLKHATCHIGINNININLNMNIDLKKYYLFNTLVSKFDLFNTYLIIGTNPKVDSPILNMKIKHIKHKFNKSIKIGYIGSRITINYTLCHIGLTSNSMLQILNGKNFYCKILKNCYNIVCLLGHGINITSNSSFHIIFNLLSSF